MLRTLTDSEVFYLKYLNLDAIRIKKLDLQDLGTPMSSVYTDGVPGSRARGAGRQVPRWPRAASTSQGDGACAPPPCRWATHSTDARVRPRETARSAPRQHRTLCFSVRSENRNGAPRGGGLDHGHRRPAGHSPQVREAHSGQVAAA